MGLRDELRKAVLEGVRDHTDSVGLWSSEVGGPVPHDVDTYFSILPVPFLTLEDQEALFTAYKDAYAGWYFASLFAHLPFILSLCRDKPDAAMLRALMQCTHPEWRFLDMKSSYRSSRSTARLPLAKLVLDPGLLGMVWRNERTFALWILRSRGWISDAERSLLERLMQSSYQAENIFGFVVPLASDYLPSRIIRECTCSRTYNAAWFRGAGLSVHAASRRISPSLWARFLKQTGEFAGNARDALGRMDRMQDKVDELMQEQREVRSLKDLSVIYHTELEVHNRRA